MSRAPRRPAGPTSASASASAASRRSSEGRPTAAAPDGSSRGSSSSKGRPGKDGTGKDSPAAQERRSGGRGNTRLRLRRGGAESPAQADAGGDSSGLLTLQNVAYADVIAAHLPPALRAISAELAVPPLTKQGVRGFPGVDPAQLLLFQTMQKRKVRGEVLDLSAMGGLLAALPGVTELRAVDGSAAALLTLAAAGLHPVAAVPGDDLREFWPQPARTVACVLAGDRGTAYAAAQVAWAHACTPPGGKLYLAGDRDKGFDRYVRLASKAFGTGETIARDGGMRVAVLTRRPGPTPDVPQPEGYEVDGLQVVGLPGVFSSGRPDKATLVLLDTLGRTLPADLSGQSVLDLGSGAGLIGAWAARRGAAVTLADGDLQSVRSSTLTLRANRLPGEALHSDVDSALGDARFDLVLSNPPFHVGRGTVLDVAREFIAAARRRLNPGGQMILVSNDFLPYEAELQSIGAVRELTRGRGFKVLAARR